jgi:type III secretion system FlhB-like substrate exporter
MAFSYGIVIVEDKLLAQALYRCALGQAIPDELYGPVAAIYRKMNTSSASVRGANA